MTIFENLILNVGPYWATVITVLGCALITGVVVLAFYLTGWWKK